MLMRRGSVCVCDRLPPLLSTHTHTVSTHMEEFTRHPFDANNLRRCDGCLVDVIQGDFWQCNECPNYDLCQQCYDDAVPHVHGKTIRFHEERFWREMDKRRASVVISSGDDDTDEDDSITEADIYCAYYDHEWWDNSKWNGEPVAVREKNIRDALQRMHTHTTLKPRDLEATCVRKSIRYWREWRTAVTMDRVILEIHQSQSGASIPQSRRASFGGEEAEPTFIILTAEGDDVSTEIQAC